MADNLPSSEQAGWLEKSGLLHIFRIVGLALQPTKLGLALATLVLTFIFGSALDIVASVGDGVDGNAIDRFVMAKKLGQAYEAQAGDYGIFEAWREHAERCVFGLMGSSVPGSSVAEGTPLGDYFATHASRQPLRNLTGIAYGVWWMIECHTVFFVVLAIGALFLWGLGGGAICRAAAVQFAQDEKTTFSSAVRYAREFLVGGFVLAPCIPLVFALIVAILLTLSGVLLRIPFFGDLVGGLLFVVSLVGGFIIAVLLIGLLAGGSLMWPAVAAEGQDAYDAFARSLSYAFSKPWKTAIYAIIALVYASLSWVFINLFTYFALATTRAIVGFGTSWWTRVAGEDGANKLELLWPFSGPSALYAWPQWSQLNWWEYMSAFIIGVYVLLIVGLMFSFLVSFYFSASTVIYFLLRRDVDKIDLEEIYMEEIVTDDLEL